MREEAAAAASFFAGFWRVGHKKGEVGHIWTKVGHKRSKVGHKPHGVGHKIFGGIACTSS